MNQTAAAKEIVDDPKLLGRMLDDMRRAEGIWHPKARWHGYASRIERELEANGLRAFRQNYNLLKGFASGGVPNVQEPEMALKRAALRVLTKLPGMRDVLSNSRRHLVAAHRQIVDIEIAHAKLLLERLSAEFPSMQVPSGLCNGGSTRCFEWRGHQVSADWVPYLSRAADLYRRVDPNSIGSILEVGAGLCFSPLAHFAMNPSCRVIVNIDIPPILYIATQFLKSMEGIEVFDYLAADALEISICEGALPRIYMLAPWQLPRLAGRFDIMLNAASFQEMTPDVCEAYAAEGKRLVDSHAMIHCSDPRREKTEGTPRGAWSETTIPSSQLISLFQGTFPNAEIVNDGWCLECSSRGYRAVLMSR